MFEIRKIPPLDRKLPLATRAGNSPALGRI
jgi:hypothetical protein